MAFGQGDTQSLWNNREGETPGTEIALHDDEPVVEGEANMDSSSDSGSDGDETPEDKTAQAEALARAEAHVQLSAEMAKGKGTRKKAKKAQVMLHSFAQASGDDPKLAKIWKHRRALKQNPDRAFGAGADIYSNTRDGGAPGTEINMHNDEPVVMGETNMDSSSDSESDGEETKEDQVNYEAALNRAEARAQKSFVQLGADLNSDMDV